MKLSVRHRCSDFKSYRAARVKSLFNVESGANFALDAELPIDDAGWKIGVIVGPSGSGKSSLGEAICAHWTQICASDTQMYRPSWPDRRPVVDAIAPRGSFDQVTAALASVGLGTVPAWLRPYKVLSNGERFRADLARLVSEAPARAVVDEFTSVVDRQIAKVGALAFQKAWRRAPISPASGNGRPPQCVLLSCHYDILDWLEPDWIFDTATGKYAGRGLWRRPRFEVELWETDWRYWPLFEPHHYLKLPRMIAATNYVATVDGELVAHVAVATRQGLVEARACRLVVMPEWQGAGVGLRFLDAVCQRWREGKNRYGLKLSTLFHTSHPGLAAALRRSPAWTQVSAALCGSNRERSKASIARSHARGGRGHGGGYGGHFRAVQGFRYLGASR